MNADAKVPGDVFAGNEMHIDRDPAARASFASDLSGDGIPPAAVARPATLGALVETCREALDRKVPLVPRGGGASYTAGFQSDRTDAFGLDLSALRNVDVDAGNRTIVAEAGATWADLEMALAETGLRCPFQGPLSGLVATIGGALSQDAIFFGSATHGAVGASVTGLEVMDGRGRVLRFGSLGPPGASGPDLTGAFIGDCGALGVKLRAALRLIAEPAASGFASFAFPDLEALLRGHLWIADRPGLSEVWGLDPASHRALNRTRIAAREAIALAADSYKDASSLADVGRRTAGLAKAAALGLPEDAYSLHVTLEGDDNDAVAARRSAMAAGLGEFGGRALAPTLPELTRARLFRPLKSVFGPAGERWLPTHGAPPRNDLLRAGEALRAHLDSRSEAMAAHGVTTRLLTSQVGPDIVLEPQLLWPDAPLIAALRLAPADVAERWRTGQENPDARRFAHTLRSELAALLRDHDARQYQLGRAYPYLSRIDAGAAAVIRSLKSELDPHSLINPGVLGLGEGETSHDL